MQPRHPSTRCLWLVVPVPVAFPCTHLAHPGQPLQVVTLLHPVTLLHLATLCCQAWAAEVLSLRQAAGSAVAASVAELVAASVAAVMAAAALVLVAEVVLACTLTQTRTRPCLASRS